MLVSSPILGVAAADFDLKHPRRLLWPFARWSRAVRAPAFDRPAHRGSWEFRQQDYTAVGMHEELNSITRLQPKMVTNRFRYGGLALNRDRGFHVSLHYIS